MRGAAFLDDSTLWDHTKKEPNIDAIERRDYQLAARGVINTVRLAVKTDYFMDEHGNCKEQGFQFLDKQREFCHEFGFKLLIDMHIPAGGAIQDFGVTEQNQRFWQCAEAQERFIDAWQHIAERYAFDATIAGYELFNEPAGATEAYWWLIKRTITAIRAVDKKHLLAVQADRNWHFDDLQDDNLLCIYHFYEPLFFTHQNVVWNPIYKSEQPIAYPGMARDHAGKASSWDRTRIQENIRNIASIAKSKRRPVIIGEFALATAIDDISQRNWLTDVIESIEQEGLSGYIYWRQKSDATGALAQTPLCNMAIVNRDGYFGRTQYSVVYRPTIDIAEIEKEYFSGQK